MKINFNYLSIQKKFTHSEETRKLIRYIIGREKKKLGAINIVFTNNSSILLINKKYLHHSYYTDVITFNNSIKNIVSGDIFVSVNQVIINSKRYNTQKLEELFRVIIHGVLHLIGYVDESEEDRKMMKNKEDFYLARIRESQTMKSNELIL